MIIRKNNFIAETAARIYASMFANPNRDPSTSAAIKHDEELWNELNKKAYPDAFGRIRSKD